MSTQDYERVARAIRFIQDHFREQPSLEAIAASVDLSPFHFERLFKSWAGTTPKRFAQCLKLEHAKSLLRGSTNLLEAAWDSGLSGPSRLHDLFCTLEAVTPGEYRSQGAALEIRYGLHPTPFGPCLLATTPRGICRLAFVDADIDQAVARLERDWPRAVRRRDPRATGPLVERIFSRRVDEERERFHLFVRGTNFQVQVWRALLAIPRGHAVSYGSLAERMGHPRSARAVARAAAANPAAYLIPCHRVLRRTGALGGYRWGAERKRAILAWESAS